jgi:hypothetical protein
VLVLTCLYLMDIWLSIHVPCEKLLMTHAPTHTQGRDLLCEQVRGEDRAPEVWRGSACELSLSTKFLRQRVQMMPDGGGDSARGVESKIARQQESARRGR